MHTSAVILQRIAHKTFHVRYRSRLDSSTSTNSPSLESNLESQPSTSAGASTSSPTNSSNINIIFEHLVTNLLADTTGSNPSATSNNNDEPGPSTSAESTRTENRYADMETSESNASNQCARTSIPQYMRQRSLDSSRASLNEGTSSQSSIGPSSLSNPGRRRYMSAFFSTRPQNGSRDPVGRFSPIRGSFSTVGLSESFPPDEVINYSERVSSGNDRDFMSGESSTAPVTSPPPPIRPENIGK